MASYLGIDPTCSSRRRSAYAVIDDAQDLLELDTYREDQDLLDRAVKYLPCSVAIDAPLGLPLGLHCLEESCPCKPDVPLKGRSAERALSALGISCYYTTKRSFIKPMIYRAMTLKRELEARGATVLEVYPYASKVALWKPIPPNKRTFAHRKFIERHLALIFPGLQSLTTRLTHDLCDALIAAHTAYLHSRGKTQALGDPAEEQIIVPKGT